MPVVTGTFTATGRSAPFEREWNHSFNFSIWGTFVARVQLERSFDRGVTWLPVTAFGTEVEFSVPVSEVWEEPENLVYCLNCEAFTSGVINYRISQ